MIKRRGAFLCLAVLTILIAACASSPSPDSFTVAKPNYDPEIKYADIDTGIKMAYVDLGNPGDPVMVMIHGVTGSVYVYPQMAAVLTAAGYRVILVDLRGHGHSDKPEAGPYTTAQHVDDVNALLNKLNIRNANITGHSLGSVVAQGLAARYPDKVATLSLIGTAATFKDNTTLAYAQGVIGNMQEVSAEFVTEWYGASKGNYDQEFSVKIFENGKAMPAYAWRNAIMGCEAYPELVPDIKVPVLIIWGTEDVFFGKKDQIDLINQLGSTHIEFLVKNGKGHDLFFDGHMGEELSLDIYRFLQGIK
jgi:pimeloyl-ACP methyl ester carboxylesterase